MLLLTYDKRMYTTVHGTAAETGRPQVSPCSEQPRMLYPVAYKRRTPDAEPLALSQHPTKTPIRPVK